MKKEETRQGVIEEAEEGDVGEYLTKEEDGKYSIGLRKKTEEIEDEIETEEFQESGEMKKEGRGLESEEDRNQEGEDMKEEERNPNCENEKMEERNQESEDKKEEGEPDESAKTEEDKKEEGEPEGEEGRENHGYPKAGESRIRNVIMLHRILLLLDNLFRLDQIISQLIPRFKYY